VRTGAFARETGAVKHKAPSHAGREGAFTDVGCNLAEHPGLWELLLVGLVRSLAALLWPTVLLAGSFTLLLLVLLILRVHTWNTPFYS
jgi:hypothetical protein